MRGVLLDRTSDRYGFQVYPYLNPLYGSARSVGFCDPIHGAAWKVYEPYFEDLLFDALREDIFAPLGRLATLDDLAEELGTRGARDESSALGRRMASASSVRPSAARRLTMARTRVARSARWALRNAWKGSECWSTK